MTQTDATFVEMMAARARRQFQDGAEVVDTELERLVALARKGLGNEDAEGREASLCDLLNSWARESGVVEAEQPEESKALTGRLWAHWTQRLATAETRVRELEVDATGVEDALEVWSSMPCGCDGTHASLAELSKCLLDGAEAREQERGLLYNEALTLLLECDHGDERTCGCRDSAKERIAALARRTP